MNFVWNAFGTLKGPLSSKLLLAFSLNLIWVSFLYYSAIFSSKDPLDVKGCNTVLLRAQVALFDFMTYNAQEWSFFVNYGLVEDNEQMTLATSQITCLKNAFPNFVSKSRSIQQNDGTFVSSFTITPRTEESVNSIRSCPEHCADQKYLGTSAHCIHYCSWMRGGWN